MLKEKTGILNGLDMIPEILIREQIRESYLNFLKFPHAYWQGSQVYN